MSDQPSAVGFKQVPGQAPAAPSGIPEQTPTQPQYITREEAERMAQEAAEAAFRRAQGLIDKSNSKVLQKVQGDLQAISKSIELQRQAGIDITPQPEEQLKQTAIARALAQVEPESPPEPNPPAAQPGGQQGQEPQDPTTLAAWAMMEAAGVVIEDGDPEAEQLDYSSPQAFLKSIPLAIAAKSTRVSSTTTPTTAGGQGMYNPNPIEHINDPTELLNIAFGVKRR